MSVKEKKRKKKKSKLKGLPVKKLSEIDNRKSFVFYGRPGSGKTSLAATFPGPILLLDIRDKGTDSLDDDQENVDVMELEHWDDFEMVYWYIKKNPNKYKTVIVDTVTQLQLLAIEKTLEDQKKSTANAGDWGTMRKQDWGTVSSMMKSYITHLRDLEPLIVFLAQERAFNVDEENEEEGFEPEIGPRLSPATASHLNAEASVIGNTFIRMRTLTKEIIVKNKKTGKKIKKIKELDEEEPGYFLRLGPNPLYVTKARKPKKKVLPDDIHNPTYKKLIKAMT